MSLSDRFSVGAGVAMALPDLKQCLGLAGLAAVGTAASLSVPAVIGNIVHLLSIGDPSGAIPPRALLLLAIAAVMVAANAGTRIVAAVAAARVFERLHVRLMESFYLRPLSHWRSFAEGEKSTLFTSDAAAIGDFVQNAFSEWVGCAFKLTGVLAILGAIYGPVALLALLYVPLNVLISGPLGSPCRAAAQNFRASATRYGARILESVSGIYTLRVFGGYDWDQRRFSPLLRERSVSLVRLRLRTEAFSVTSLAFWALVALTYTWGGKHVRDGSLGVGEVVTLVGYITQLHDPVGRLTGLWAEFKAFQGNASRLTAELAWPGALHECIGAGLTNGQRNVSVQMEGVSARYAADGPLVVRELSFSFAGPGVVCIVGPNGVGKSAVFHLLTGALEPLHGAVRLGGRSIRDIGPEGVGYWLSAARSSSMLFAGTLIENLRLADPSATRDEILEVLTEVGLGPLIGRLEHGLDTRTEETGPGLSAGELQRFAIARCLLHKGVLILLDEALSSVDAESDAAVLRALRRASEEKLIVSITHDLEQAAQADAVIFIPKSCDYRVGTHHALMNSCPEYRSFFEQFVSARKVFSVAAGVVQS